MTITHSYPSLRAAVLSARRLLQQGSAKEAAQIYRDLPTMFTDNKKQAFTQAGEGLLKCGLWSEAVAAFNAGLTLNPVSPSYLGGLAEAYAAAENYPRAVTYLQKNIERDPSAVNLTGLGVMQMLANDWTSAEESFARALAVEPLKEDACVGRGDALQRLGRRDEALAAYRRVVSINPNNADALLKLGSLLVDPKSAAEGEALLRRSIDIEPRNTPAYVNLATACSLQNKPAEAVLWARKAVEMNPEAEGAQYILGATSLEAGDFAGALPALRRAAELAPGHAGAMSAVAIAEGLLDNVRAAERAWQIVLALEPKNMTARHMLTALLGGALPALPEKYAEQYFDSTAGDYDHMRAPSYQAPQSMAALLSELTPRRTFKNFLDIGCGTGLVAEALSVSEKFEASVGIDVSAKMLEIARVKNVYSDLIQGDAASILNAMSEPFDLITAIDLFPYVGDLSTLIPAIARCLAPKGVFAYSAESLNAGKYKLERTGRFNHSTSYVEDLARAGGLTPVGHRAITLRAERSRPVAGVVGLFEKTA